MLRNRDLLLQALTSAAIALVCGVGAWALASPEAGMWTLVAGLAIGAVHVGFSYKRFRDIARLSEHLDDALLGERTLDFRDMSEGELAILANGIDKALVRLVVANERLEKEKSQLADSLADISHQLRTPLTSLGLEFELMRRSPNEDDRRTHALSAQRQLEQLSWLVSSLLKLARLDAGQVELMRQQVDVERLVRASSVPLEVAFDLADVRFESAVEPGTRFEGDPAWTREALTNVLKNCLEHTPAGGAVRLTASGDSLACRIRVQDTGPGISEEDLPHIFERFYRGSRRLDKDRVEPAGVGIGLSLSRALIAAQDGAITASNALDAEGRVVGARFDIVFPKVRV